MEIGDSTITALHQLPLHQVCEKSLAALGLNLGESLGLGFDPRVDARYQVEIAQAFGAERVERYRLTLAMERFAGAVDRLVEHLTTAPKQPEKPPAPPQVQRSPSRGGSRS